MKSRLIISIALGFASVSAASEPASLADAFNQGKASLNLRLRYEGVQQTALKDADALTLRTRLGFTTAPFHGWQTMLEAENIAAVDGDRYSQAGLNAGGTGRAVVADPENTELNQAWLRYVNEQTTVTLGRQRLVLDNARFVGDVGWRQNMQTFDALVVQDKSLDKTELTYAYLNQINRIFGHRHAQGRWDSDSHLFNIKYPGLTGGALTGYAYLLDFDNAAANSCATYGASFDGKTKINDKVNFTYRLEYARQSDYGSNPLSYSTDYKLIEAGLSGKPGALSLGHEALGSDRAVGFKTPLATLHAFNGWADMYLGTPATGLRDTFVKAMAKLPGDVALLAFFHRYDANPTNTSLGHEWDVQVSRKFGKNVSGALKYANFTSDQTAAPKVRKIWLELEYAL
jgi:hypothetical protein